jgi:rod shape-determining protein MreD
MKGRIIIYSLLLVLSLVQVTVITALPLYVASVNLPLVLIAALTLGLKPRSALTGAVIAGLVIDLLTPAFFGIHTVSLVVTALLVSLLVFRVLSHHTWLAVAGINAGMLLVYQLLIFIFMSAVRLFAGASVLHPATGQAILYVASSLLIQVCLAISVRLLAQGFRRYSSQFILVN